VIEAAAPPAAATMNQNSSNVPVASNVENTLFQNEGPAPAFEAE
jgi:hypothetical protein